MADEDIFKAINEFPAARWIILTGGEPSLQIDSEFICSLKEATGKKVAIETNGTMSLPDNIDWITLSPKYGICGNEEIGEVVINHTDEVKVVDVGQPLDAYFSLSCIGSSTRMYLQPCYVSDEKERRANRARTIERVMADPRWTLSVQLHRFLGIL